MRNRDCLLRLNPTVEYQFDDAGPIIVKVKRGESLTRYSVNRTIYEFLERFREPTTLQEVARAMSEQGFDIERVLHFGRHIVKTPMIEFYDPHGSAADGVASLLQSFGYRLELALKHRKFDGVFKVRGSDGEPLILKLLHTPDPGNSGPIRLRLRNEFRILQELEPVEGVVSARGFNDGETPFFAMEFLPGVPLTRRHGGSLRTSLAMCSQVARIVGRIHRHGIVHGDLHTSNFLADERDRISLIDFDCSFFGREDYRPRVGGAIHFLPPERVIGSWNERSVKHANTASDIYQAAVVIYSILAGDMPYRGRTLSELSANIRTGRFRPLEATGSGEAIPPAVVDFVHQALDPDQDARPDNMDGFPSVHE